MPRARTLQKIIGLITASVVPLLTAAAVEVAAQSPTFSLSAEQAVALALENNLTLKSERLGPSIADAEVAAALSAWTPELSTALLGASNEAAATTAIDAGQGSVIDWQLLSNVAMTQRLPWGASYEVGWNGSRRTSNSAFTRFTPELRAGASATLVQPLLRGLRFDAARAARESSLRARDAAGSQLGASVAAVRREVLYAYWSWIHARDFLAVQQQSLALARALLDGNRARVAAGAMAAVDVIEAEAEVARRTEAIVVGEKTVANADDRLRMLIFAPGQERTGERLEPALEASTAAPPAAAADESFPLQREDLKSLRAAADIEGISARRFRNESLPDVSLRLNYALSGSGGTELLRAQGFGGPVTGSVAHGFGSVLDDLVSSRYPAWSLALEVSYPIGPARPEAEATRATLRQRQAEASLQDAERRAAVEWRAAAREVDANNRRLESTATAVTLSERRLDAEQRKFAVGLSTSFFVFQAQRDLASAREARLRAELDHRLSIADSEAARTIPISR